MLLQKVVLLGSLLLAGLGSLPAGRTAGLARLRRRQRADLEPVRRRAALDRPLDRAPRVRARCPGWSLRGPGPASSAGYRAPLLVLLPVGSLSANAGLVSAIVVLGVGLTAPRSRQARRTAIRLVAVVAAANAPWIVAGLLHAGSADTATGARFFSLHGDGLPAPLSALTLGGIWNSAVVPGTRDWWLLPTVATALVVMVGLLGFRRHPGAARSPDDRGPRRLLGGRVRTGPGHLAVPRRPWTGSPARCRAAACSGTGLARSPSACPFWWPWRETRSTGSPGGFANQLSAGTCSCSLRSCPWPCFPMPPGVSGSTCGRWTTRTTGRRPVRPSRPNSRTATSWCFRSPATGRRPGTTTPPSSTRSVAS